ncbi:MAG: hypothetical protein HQL47_11190 [Gammaproteobacteria bacterium]|nr:hypothetical protein [Gammaproteobacteria bacterium]
MDEQVAARFEEVSALARQVVARLHQEIETLGFDPRLVQLQEIAAASYTLQTDPADGGQSLVGEWRDGYGIKVGELKFHADGSFFVEQDVVRPHPKRSGWFVEAVNAWGRGSQIRAEARLLRMPG